jgi:hypothetical protein
MLKDYTTEQLFIELQKRNAVKITPVNACRLGLTECPENPQLYAIRLLQIVEDLDLTEAKKRIDEVFNIVKETMELIVSIKKTI